jgi:hypothetical protein
MSKVGAKKYDEAWWNDMMSLPKPLLVHFLMRANKRADRAEESAPTAQNNASAQLLSLVLTAQDLLSCRSYDSLRDCLLHIEGQLRTVA